MYNQFKLIHIVKYTRGLSGNLVRKNQTSSFGLEKMWHMRSYIMHNCV